MHTANSSTTTIRTSPFDHRPRVRGELAALMEYRGMTLQEAAEEVVMKKLVAAGGSGGIVAVDRDGHVSMTFNSPGMYRGYAKPGERVVKIYKD